MAASRRVAIRKVESEDRLQMSLTFANEAGQPRVFTFNRMKAEELGMTLERIKGNVSKFINKAKTNRMNKIRKKDPEAAAKLEKELEVVNACVRHNGELVDNNVPNDKVWVEGAVLQIEDESYQVELNIPAVTSMKLPKTILSGFPCYPRLEAEFVDLNHCEFVWYREKTEDSEEGKGGAKKKGKSKATWETVHTGHTYMPSNDDIGKRLRLVCIPRNGAKVGDETEVISTVEVSAGPGLCPFDNRHAFTATTAPAGEFRIVCYNLLADIYADSDFSRANLFPYCPNYALEFDYRQLLILKELTGYNADIICLQECDRRFFMRDLLFVMESHGMNGSFLQKYGAAGEGEAIFYREEKFKFIEQTELNLTESLKTDPMHADLWTKVQQNEELTKHVSERSTCLQTVLLESKEDSTERVLVATTHLFFHPKANFIRILQTEVILKHIEELLSKYGSQGSRPSVIFCGDLNSSPYGSVVEYINTGMLPEDCKDFFDENKQRLVPEHNFHHSLKLTSACGIPEYTNFTSGFVGTLDHIFVDSTTLKTTQIVPMPTHEELSQFVAIPSVVMPSDHIALVCDIAFQNEDSDNLEFNEEISVK